MPEITVRGVPQHLIFEHAHVLRAANMTRMPSERNKRASDALKPSPTPTIKADSDMVVSTDCVQCFAGVG